jgi:hypothetical protein
LARVPVGFDETIKVEHLLHHATVVRNKYNYPRPPHIILVDDRRETVGGLTSTNPGDVPTNTALRVTQLPAHHGWGVDGDAILWEKDNDEQAWRRGVGVIRERVHELRSAGRSVDVVFDWDNTLHSGGGWTAGKINRWRVSDLVVVERREPNGLDELNPELVAYIQGASTSGENNVTFGVATHNSFHKGDGRSEVDVFAADLILYWLQLVSRVYGRGRFEVVTSGRPDRAGGSVNLWVPDEVGFDSGSREFCKPHSSAGDASSILPVNMSCPPDIPYISMYMHTLLACLKSCVFDDGRSPVHSSTANTLFPIRATVVF